MDIKTGPFYKSHVDFNRILPGGLPPRTPPTRVASLRKWSRFAPGWKILHIFDGNPIGEYIMRGGLRPPLTTWWRAPSAPATMW